MTRRKVLFILIDQMRADCVSGALAEAVPLPNITAFRKQAVTFLNHFSVTNPCGPARASILTGLYAMNHRSVRNGTPLSAEHSNLALEMRKLGYDPLLFGYTDTSHDPRTGHPKDPRLLTYEGVMPGFHEVVEMCFDQSYPWRAHLKKKGYDLPPFERFYDPVPSEPGRPPRPDDPPFYRAEDSDTAFLTDAFLDQMAVRQEQGWFALLTYIRPHPPLVAPAPWNRAVDPASLPPPVRARSIAAEEAVHPFMAAHRIMPSMRRNLRGPAADQVDETRDADVQLLRALYLGLALEVDHHVGRILSFLKDSGAWEDTLIVLTADHGEMLGDHHMWGKQQVYDPAFRVPLIIRDPDLPATHGRTVEALTESIDLAPTILDCAGGRVPVAMNGRSLRPFLAGTPPADWKTHVMMELDFGDPQLNTPMQDAGRLPLRQANLAILRSADWKLVHFNGGLPPLLFDLRADPGELHDLAPDPAHAPVLLEMTRKLLSHRMSHADSTLSGMKVAAEGVLGYDPFA